MNRGVLLGLVFACVGLTSAIAADGDKPTLAMAKIVSNIQEGQKWGRAASYIGCTGNPIDLHWGSGPGRLNLRALEQPAREELKKENFKISGDLTDPFASQDSADFSIGGTITAVQSLFCYNSVLFGNRSGLSGSTKMGVDWEIYSNTEREVVAKIHTDGEYETKAQIEGGFEAIMISALDESLKKLTASSEFQQAISRRLGSSSSPPASSSSPKSALTLVGAKTAGPTKIPDAVGSVVLILSGGGHGSGFLVSADGYVMTAEHVVGSDKYVKIRWSDGLEGVGEVIRTDKRRDAALIKTDPRNRQPLALRRESPQPGDTVFAIGAPIDPKLQSTVTRGVVSASNRIMDGFSFIQSDVTVDPGNSGGPLLDEQGRVLGFTDKGIRTAEAPTGLNFFVPIDDALRFLSAEPQ